MPMDFDYYYGNESKQFSFYRIPKILFKDKMFKSVSTDAKVLYGLMLDRMGLSIKNGWFDKENRVYIVYKISDIMEDLNCADQKVGRLLSELDNVKGIGLIERKRQGLGKPNIIYVKNFCVTLQKPNSENHASKEVKITNQDVLDSQVKNSDNQTFEDAIYTNQETRKSQPNHTDISENVERHTDFNNHILSYPQKVKTGNNDVNDEIRKREEYQKIISDNIEYGYLAKNYSKDTADGILETILDAVCSTKEYLRVKEEMIPQEVVKSRLLKLNYEHVEYVLMCMRNNTTKVHNIKNYMLTALYNSFATKDQYYTTEINHNLYGNEREE